MTALHDDPWLMLPSIEHEGAAVAQDALHIETIEDVEPLDRQFGVHPKKSVPDVLHDALFGQPYPTEAEIAAAGDDAAAVPHMQTYAILDAAKVKNFPELLGASELEHRCLFKGNAYDEMKDVAPWIVRLEDGNDFTRRLFTGPEGINGLWDKEPGIYLRSRATLDDMWRHFRKFTRVQGADEKSYFFRFWSHHVFLAWMMQNRKKSTIVSSFFQDRSKVIVRTIMAYDAPVGRLWKITPDHSVIHPELREPFKLSSNEKSIFRRAIVRPFAVEIVPYLKKEYADLCSDYSLIGLHSAVEISLMRLHDYGFLRHDILTELLIQDLYLGYPFEDEDDTGKMRQICRSDSSQEIRYQRLCEIMDDIADFEQVDGVIQ